LRIQLLLSAFLLLGLPLNAQDSPSPDIRLNSLGYLSAWPKHASVLNADKARAWGLHRAGDGQRVAKGLLTESSSDSDTGHSLRSIDFSAYRGQGLLLPRCAGPGPQRGLQDRQRQLPRRLSTTMLGLYGLRCGNSHQL